jgi:hypothetical protein
LNQWAPKKGGKKEHAQSPDMTQSVKERLNPNTLPRTKMGRRQTLQFALESVCLDDFVDELFGFQGML